MREIGEKDFEYYESQASYFAYTHDLDDYDCGISDEYLELDQKVIKAVEKLGTQDRVERKLERSVEQLAEFIVSEKLLPKEKVEPVKYELHMDYTLAYDYYDAKNEQNKQNKERRGI